MTVTTIKVDSAVRDRLARLAAEQGRSIGAVVADLASAAPTEQEKLANAEAVERYFHDNFGMEMTQEGLARAEALWQQIEARKSGK